MAEPTFWDTLDAQIPAVMDDILRNGYLLTGESEPLPNPTFTKTLKGSTVAFETEMHINVMLNAFQPGDRVLIGFSNEPGEEEMAQAKAKLEERFPDVNFTFAYNTTFGFVYQTPEDEMPEPDDEEDEGTDVDAATWPPDLETKGD